MAEVVDNGQPAHEQQEGSGLEPVVGCAGGSSEAGLLGGALQFQAAPIARDAHEEVEPPPQVEEEGHPKLELCPLVIHLESEGIRVDVLSLLPAAPVADGLPDGGHCTEVHEVPEEGGEDDWDLGEVIAVDVDVCDEADEAGGAHCDHPVPLPSPANGPEALLGGQEHAAMPAEADECEHQGHAEDDGQADADEAPGRYGLDGRVA